MISSTYLFTFTSLLASYSTSAHPIAQPSLLQRQTDCTALNNGFDPSCWSTLGLSNYLDNWNKTTPLCTENNASGCCHPNELWSNCFIRLATNGLRTDDCSIINKACATEPTYAEEQVAPTIAPEVYYIVHNIYYINDFFTSWYTALNTATLSTLLLAQPLINEIDPDQKSRFALSDLLTALTVGLAFLPAIGAPSSLALSTLHTALQQAPSVAKEIWPAGTTDSKSIQLAQIDTALSQASANFTTGVTNALADVMADVQAFMAFAQNGTFSGADQVDLPDDAADLGLALNTFVLSTALSANGWRATPSAEIMTRADVQSNIPGSGGEACTFVSSEDDSDICTDSSNYTAVFFSEDTGRAYSFAYSPSSSIEAEVSPFELMNDIVANKWSELEALFDGAFNCTVQGGVGEGLDFFGQENTDGPDFACVSQLDMCIACGADCPVAVAGGGMCPFAACEACG